MIKIINGKRYNTETSTTISAKDYTCNGNWMSSTYLEKTPKGNYFLYTQGGSNYGSPASDISALTKREAFEYACENHQIFTEEEHQRISEEFADLIEEA